MRNKVPHGQRRTSTTQEARADARAQAGAEADAMPTLPASAWPLPVGDVAAADLVWAETVAGGGYTSKLLAPGARLRLTDPLGDACAHLLLYNADQPWERLNVADTVKVPWQAYIGTGHPLLSDQGRVLGVVTADTSGRHDALCGTSSLAANEASFGDGAPQGPSPAGHELQLLAALKHGLGEADVPPSLSFFKGVRVAADGELEFQGSAGPGGSVELRLELPTIVILANVPHPADPRPSYTVTTLEVIAWRGKPTPPADPLGTSTPELERAFLNTADYANARGN